jgi:plasmid stabilization system protein ParE
MSYRVIITGPAKRDMREAVDWWRDKRSAAQAERWYEKILPTIETLAENPQRCPISPEADLLPTGLRQLHFGLSRKTTHRIVFTIVGSDVFIVRVRHVAQQDLGLDDIAPP